MTLDQSQAAATANLDLDERPVRVLIVDDNLVIRRGLASLLEVSGRVVVTGEAIDGEDALAMAQRHRPDVILLDVRMPAYDGFYALPRLAAMSRVLMVTCCEDQAVIGQALRDGATGYLIYGQFKTEALLDAVLATAAGRPHLSPAVVSALVHTVRTRGPSRTEHAEPVTTHGLSPREVEIMELLVQGRGNVQIARTLYISDKTVKNHLYHIYAKLGTRNRAESSALWLGLVAPGEKGR